MLSCLQLVPVNPMFVPLCVAIYSMALYNIKNSRILSDFYPACIAVHSTVLYNIETAEYCSVFSQFASGKIKLKTFVP